MIRKKLCLDLGQKRVGVAVSDALGSFAHPLEPIVIEDGKGLASNTQFLNKLKQLIAEHDPDQIVIGHPVNLKGERAKTALRYEEAAGFIGDNCPGLSIVLQDERFSTAAVERLAVDHGIDNKSIKHKKDSLAAQWILQGYLDGLRMKRQWNS